MENGSTFPLSLLFFGGWKIKSDNNVERAQGIDVRKKIQFSED
jgi:hypothetical protein